MVSINPLRETSLHYHLEIAISIAENAVLCPELPAERGQIKETVQSRIASKQRDQLRVAFLSKVSHPDFMRILLAKLQQASASK